MTNKTPYEILCPHCGERIVLTYKSGDPSLVADKGEPRSVPTSPASDSGDDDERDLIHRMVAGEGD